MATLQVRDMDDRVYEELKRVARRHRRSLSQEVVQIIESYLRDPDRKERNQTEEFLKLSGSWADDRTAEKIVSDLRSERRNSDRFSESPSVFD